MKITCPQCNASGTLPDHEIPAEGRFLNCPRCKYGFTVNRPKPSGDAYLVDTCPACYFSTFGDERFETCPKCGVTVKAFVARQRDEQQRQKEQELLTRKFSRDDQPAEPLPDTRPMADMIDSLQPVTMIGWGVALVASVGFAFGLWGLLDYYGTDIRAQLSAQRDEDVSAVHVFLNYGLMPWIETLFGGAGLGVSVMFLKRRTAGRIFLSRLLKCLMGFIPIYQIVSFVNWIREPVPHSVSGYLVEIFSILFVATLLIIPLYLLDRFLDERRIRSVVNQ